MDRTGMYTCTILLLHVVVMLNISLALRTLYISLACRHCRLWQLGGCLVTPAALGVLLVLLPCTLPLYGLHRFLVHFYLFAVLTVLAAALAVCFPVVTNDRKVL